MAAGRRRRFCHGQVFADYTPLVEVTTVSYWDVRSRQAQTSKDLGVLDAGIRSEETGGRHLDELHRLIVRVFIAGVPADMLEVRKRPIPGFLRRDKSWDVEVTVGDRVVGIVELKSMAGEEPGKNYNNRPFLPELCCRHPQSMPAVPGDESPTGVALLTEGVA